MVCFQWGRIDRFVVVVIIKLLVKSFFPMIKNKKAYGTLDRPKELLFVVMI